MNAKKPVKPIRDTEIADIGAIQELLDSVARLFNIFILLTDENGEALTVISCPAQEKENASPDRIAWEIESPLESNGKTICRIKIKRGRDCVPECFEKCASFIGDLAEFMIKSSLRYRDQQYELQRYRELERKLELRNEHDSLTNLYNRYFYEKKLTEYTAADIVPISVAVIDANLLKLSNDIFGHDEGDCLLQLISGALAEEKREGYYCCRCGGDEFYVLMENTGEEEALKYIERVKERTGSDYCTHIPPSFAAGVATRTSKEEKLQDVLKRAEDAMYLNKLEMKRNGRILGALKQCLFETGYFHKDDAVANINLALDFLESVDPDPEIKDTMFRLLELYPLGMLIIPADILKAAKGHLTDTLAEKYDYVGTEHRIAMMFEETAPVAFLVLQISESWDGTGKPGRLAGTEISFPVRMFRITTDYTKYISKPPFGYGMTKEEALKKMKKSSGKVYDPGLFERFAAFVSDYEPGSEKHNDLSGMVFDPAFMSK